MNPTTLILAVIIIQQGLFAAAWGLVWALRMAPRAAPAFVACTAALAVALALVALRPLVPDWVGWGVANMASIVSMVAFRRGVQAFAAQPTSVRDDLSLIALSSLLQFWALTFDGMLPRMGVPHVVAAPVMLHAAWIVMRHLREEFGAKLARWCAVPLGVLGALHVARVVGLLLWPAHFAVPFHEASDAGAAFILLVMAAALVTNLSLFSLIVMRVVRRLDNLTRQDAMTGLTNRRAIEDALEAETNRARRRRGSFALLALDIDHFKRINDAHGHPVGDAVLMALAQTLRDFARTGDIVARVGGEEFWILAPNTDVEGAMALAERVRVGVRRHKIHVGALELHITTSIGVAVFDNAKETPDELFKRADQALYAAKSAGRNRVQLAGAPLQPAPHDTVPAKPGTRSTEAKAA